MEQVKEKYINPKMHCTSDDFLEDCYVETVDNRKLIHCDSKQTCSGSYHAFTGCEPNFTDSKLYSNDDSNIVKSNHIVTGEYLREREEFFTD